MITKVLSLSVKVPSPSCPSSFLPHEATEPLTNKKYDDSLPAMIEVIFFERDVIS
jgi:hypothetical protein